MVGDGRTELVLDLDVSFNPEAKPYINREVSFPLLWCLVKYQFAHGVPANVRQLEIPSRNLLDLVRREFFLGTIDSEVSGQNVIVRDLEDRVEVATAPHLRSLLGTKPRGRRSRISFARDARF